MFSSVFSFLSESNLLKENIFSSFSFTVSLLLNKDDDTGFDIFKGILSFAMLSSLSSISILFFTLTGLDTFFDLAFIASFNKVIDSLSGFESVLSVFIESIFLTGVEVFNDIFLS